MKIFMILLIVLLTISTVSAWAGNSRLINCTDIRRPCGFSSKCIHGRCYPIPGPSTGLDGSTVDGCYAHGCEKPYECVMGKCVFRQI
ncbi:hypothetical protein GCK72_022709 [Caenorhabditis remanei]|uniref:EB domain-containing protein n=1 Tax=Caenorhabditis remanei TaxID=31234 RepID=A0A6A5FUR0_CAERE|nr:hypothetical protein GCK72_022709 [Caenorhabditis remanei]KAF1746256.1 hypothetical protein GCK72_022709 [Caenorhabditis remanei]